MYRLLILCFCISMSSPSCVDVAKVQKTATAGLPVLKITNDTSGKALPISRLLINVQVTGNIATTTLDITFYNAENKQLEGEFDFPLADGQSISRYALEIDDKLREGVVVEKVKARVAFENTIRRKVDPGLVEKTQGNNFRTRIYPIPAKGYKRVVIAIEQTLQATEHGLHYQLPLAADYAFEQFSMDALVALPSEQPVVDAGSWKGLQFTKDSAWEASFQQSGFHPAEDLAFTIPLKDETPLVYTESCGGKQYFYAYLPGKDSAQARPLPKSITLFWDVSSSATKRNIEKERAFLKEYLSALDNVTVTVVPFNIRTYPASSFRVSNGHTQEVLDFLSQYKEFDGGTQLGALNFQQYPADEILLLSDGVSTFGKKEVLLSRTPVTVITSAAGADFSYLKYIARQTNGRFADLTSTEPKVVSEQLLKESRHFIRAEFNAAEIEEWVTPVRPEIHQGFGIAGVLKKDGATVTLHFGYGKTTTSKQTIVIQKQAAPTGGVGRIWANMRINELDLQFEKNKEAITSLGKQFSIVTRNTSLLVLDRVEDYVEHEIEPPADLMKEYLALLKEKNDSRQDQGEQARRDAESAMEELVAWWNAPVPIKSPAALPIDTAIRPDEVHTYSFTTSDTTHVTTTAASAPPPPPTGTYNLSTSSGLQEMRLADVSDDGRTDDAKVKAGDPQPVIEVQAWKADAPYLTDLEKAAPAGRFTKYLSLRNTYSQQPSFYIEVARFFFEKGDLPVALQVLSNVAELKLENPELLRIVADQLLEFGQKDLAVETFKEVLNIREEEPQAYRDLALAYSETGNYGEAVRLLYKVATGVWDGRFGDIRQIAMLEMNAIISAHPNAVDCEGIAPRFIKALPVDVRIVIGWSADNSDIDLWVTDPRKEKCSYEHTQTALGGKISKDATQGYGPEEFLLKKAVDGSYEIEVNLFGDSRETLGGPITIKAELYTNYGRRNQQRKVLSVRVNEAKEVVKIGKLVFG